MIVVVTPYSTTITPKIQLVVKQSQHLHSTVSPKSFRRCFHGSARSTRVAISLRVKYTYSEKTIDRDRRDFENFGVEVKSTCVDFYFFFTIMKIDLQFFIQKVGDSFINFYEVTQDLDE